MKFVLAIPAYNEAEIIRETLGRIFEQLNYSFVKNSSQKITIDWCVYVVDNGSSDGTFESVKQMEKEPKYFGRLKAIRITEKGKGIAIVSGAKEAKIVGTDLFAFIDADLSIDPLYISNFVNYMKSNETTCDILTGSRLLDEKIVNRSKSRTFSSKVFSFIAHSILNIDVGDTQCGLKLFNKVGIDRLLTCRETGWFLDLEILAKAKKSGLHVVELPVKWNENVYVNRKSRLRMFRDGLLGLVAIERIRRNIRAK